MTEKTKIQMTVVEDADIVARIDAIADSEGITRADILRRAIRRYLFFVSSGSVNGSIPSPELTARES